MKFSVKEILPVVLVIAFVVRVSFSYYQISNTRIETYEYGAIAQNIVEGKGYSLFYNDNGEVGFVFNPEAKTYKSAWMPPLYVAFLVPFYLVDSESLRLLMIFLIQAFVSILVILILFNLTEIYFDSTTALITSVFYAFTPEFIFASSTIGPTVLFHLLIIMLIYYLSVLPNKKEFVHSIIVGILFGIILLLRSELLLFFLLVFITFIIKKKVKKTIIVSSIFVLILMPWQMRNYLEFDEIIPLTTSAGLNFYRGHNQFNLGDLGNDYSEAEIRSFIKYEDYELRTNSMYFEESFKAIKSQPLKEILNSFVKIFQLWIFDPNWKYSLHPLYFLPWLITLFLALSGIMRNYSWTRFEIFYLFLITTTIIAILFFVIPRYQTMFKILLLPFAADTLLYFYYKFINRSAGQIKY